MTSIKTVHRMIDELPPDLRNEAIHYIEDLAKRKKNPPQKSSVSRGLVDSHILKTAQRP